MHTPSVASCSPGALGDNLHGRMSLQALYLQCRLQNSQMQADSCSGTLSRWPGPWAGMPVRSAYMSSYLASNALEKVSVPLAGKAQLDSEPEFFHPDRQPNCRTPFDPAILFLSCSCVEPGLVSSSSNVPVSIQAVHPT